MTQPTLKVIRTGDHYVNFLIGGVYCTTQTTCMTRQAAESFAAELLRSGAMGIQIKRSGS